MCQETLRQSRQCTKILPSSEPSASRIRAQQHATKPPQGNKFTYPVVNEKLKQDSSSDDSVDKTDSDATEFYSVPSDSDHHEPETPPSTPKGSFVTKTFGVKNPSKYSDKVPKHVKKCPKCDFQTGSSAGINAHYKNTHELVVCEHCSLRFSTPSTLHQHMYLHKEMKFKCDKCSKWFPFASDLRVHQVKHESKCTHKCSKCLKKFFMEGDMLRHLKVHNKKKWTCSMCDYTTIDERNLKAHRRVHSNLKLYMCLHCLKLFKYHTQYKHHTDKPCKDKLIPRSKSPEFQTLVKS